MSSKKSGFLKPPVVTIMGHVDHGKTTLLDAIRKSKITSQEHGGITQHIGAYQVDFKGKKITFIDTPGHAAFSKMRARGAQATDIVILVVAANDGVKPQTKESLSHIKQAKAPFLIAINKIDLPDFDINMVKSQLADNDVLVEGYGGQTVCVEVSAKNKKGIDQLLEMIILMSEINEIKAKPKADLQAVVIESKLDKKRGPVATVLVQEGVLKKGDNIKADRVRGKVKNIFNDKGQELDQIGPGDPGQILGFKETPTVGVLVSIAEEKKNNQEKKELKKYKHKYKKIIKKEVIKEEEENEGEEKKEKIKIKLLLKADTYGTLEAIKANLADEIELIHSEVGEINESDILLAQAAGAQIIAFNLNKDSQIERLAEMESVRIRHFNIIYELFKELEGKVLEWLEPEIKEEQVGKGKVIAEFNIKKNHICGARVKSGFFKKNSFYRIKRKGKIIGENLRLKAMQHERHDVEKIKAGQEAALVLRPNIDFLIDDDIIAYNLNK